MIGFNLAHFVAVVIKMITNNNNDSKAEFNFFICFGYSLNLKIEKIFLFSI